jgi:outer membrane murein-binding lipoprotein Lpp
MRRITLITSLIAALLAALAVAGSASAAKTNIHGTSVVGSSTLKAKKPKKPKKPKKTKAPSRNHGASFANYAAGFMTKGNNVPQGGDRYEPGFAGWASFASGYKASHPEEFSR